MRATSSAHSAFASCCPRKSRSINGTWPSALLCLAMAAAPGVDARGVAEIDVHPLYLNHRQYFRILLLKPLPNQRLIAFDRAMQWLLAGLARVLLRPRVVNPLHRACLTSVAAAGPSNCPSRRASSASEPYIVRTRCPKLKRQPRGFRAPTHWAPYAHAEPSVLWSSERARQLFRKRTLYASISLGAWWCQASSVSIRCRPIWPALCRRTSSSRNWMIFAAKSIGSLGFA
jgi:hypothetical protein